MTTVEILEDHLDEVRTWLPLVEDGKDPITGEMIVDPTMIAEIRALQALLEEALETRDAEKMQQAQAAYEDCDFFTNPITLDPDIWGEVFGAG